jgi:hypothetical protein
MEISQKNKIGLAEKLNAYLSGEIDHSAIKSHAWALADSSPKDPVESDAIFWSCVFTIIHLADDEHWNDGCTERDLGKLLTKLKDGKG